MTRRSYRHPGVLAAALTSVAAGAAALIVSRRRAARRWSPGTALPVGTAVITGASSGIGAEYARQLAAAGYGLVFVARREDRLEALAAELARAHGTECAILAADLATGDGIDRVAKVLRNRDDVVLLINNAGFGTHGYFIDVELAKTEAMLTVHVLASVRLTHAVLPRMVERRAGAIVNVSSIAAFFAAPGGATYAATKNYLITFSEALQRELDGSGVRVQALCPGFTYSEFHDSPEYEGFDRSQIPAALWMSAEEVVAESLRALSGSQVVVVPGLQYKAMIAAASAGPLGRVVSFAGRKTVAWFRSRRPGLLPHERSRK